MARVGSSFTGQDEPDENAPLQDIVGRARNVASDVNQQLLGTPESRSALLQIGLGLMTPGFDSTGGHIARAIGEGGESVARNEAADIAEQEADTKRMRAEDALTIAELRLRNARDPNSLTEYQRQSLGLQERSRLSAEHGQRRSDAREYRQANADREKKIADAVEKAAAARDSLVLDETDPNKARWRGKTDDDIRAEYEARIPPINKDDYGLLGPTGTEEPTATEKPPAAAATSVPPPQKRVAGQVYPTPQGKLKWTGTGWVRP